MKQVYIFKGLPASGKTTEAKKMIEENPGSYKRINKDDLRAMLDNDKWTGKNEQFILQVRDYLILKALSENKHVIIDDTNLNPIHEQHIQDLIHKYRQSSGDSVTVSIKFFDIPLEECIQRDLKRFNSVGERVIRDMYTKWIAPKNLVEPLIQNSSLPRAIIVDIDGTVALKGKRDPFDWSKVKEDKPNWPVIRLIQNYGESRELHIIFVSGRDAICEADTEYWLDNYVTIDIKDSKKYSLFMRRHNDNRKDVIIKKEIYETYIKGIYFIEAVFDDRLQTCQMWYNEGLPLFRVGDPDATF